MGDVLLVGSGGREHALAEAMGVSSDLDRIYCAPGNLGTDMMLKAENMPFGPKDMSEIVSFAEAKGSGLTVVVGPEQPLVAGLADQLRARDIAVFGPGAAAARLEGSKIFAHEVMDRAGILQPPTIVARDREEAFRAVSGRRPEDMVIKADRLAGGKGVVLPKDGDEMYRTILDMLSGKAYNKAGESGILIQERLTGPEVSIFVISDGKNHSVIPHFAQDHKRLGDGDMGPNTGGMGAYTPIPEGMISERQQEQIDEIADRTIKGMSDRGTPYKGVLYMGLMLANEYDGDPVVIEYNARFGDPEAQVVLPTLTEAGVDVYDMIRETATGRVPDLSRAQLAGQAALTVCLAAEGYPDRPRSGVPIHGLDTHYPGTTVYHGGTSLVENQVVTAGGRVLYVTGRGESVKCRSR